MAKVREKATTVLGLESPTGIKKKRPWRDKVRKLAKKAAEREKREEEERRKKRAERKKRKRAEESNGDIEGEPEKKKPKKKRKKKKFVDSNGEEEKSEEQRKLEAGRFRFINEQLYTTTGENALKLFKRDPSAFKCYHEGYRGQVGVQIKEEFFKVRKWPNYPLHSICSWLGQRKPGQTVLDLGCGDAKIAESMGHRHNVLSFDLVAVNERVTACDMANLPVGTASADVVIFCLSLMGTNLGDYIHEAARVLKPKGVLKIAEVASRFENVKSFCDGVSIVGFEHTSTKHLTDYFIAFEFVRTKKPTKKAPSWLTLKPCLYKKR